VDLNEGLATFKPARILPADVRDDVRRVSDIFKSGDERIEKLINFKKYSKFI